MSFGRKYLSIKQAAAVVGVTTLTLRNWDKRGKLKARRNKNGYRIFNITELEKFAKQEGLKRPKRNIKLIK